jgi:imidazolonepropionase-like amidohydrolase
MRGVSAVTLAAALAVIASLSGAAQAQVTAFEGARIIVGDGRAVENATLVVDGGKIVAAGASNVRVPDGAAHVNLAGKTVMPMLIDVHTHLSQTREGIILDLKRRAYYGVSAAMNMGMSENEADLQLRGETLPGVASVFTAWRGITRPEPGRSKAPFWINTEAEGRAAVQELAPHKVDLVKVWIDDRDGKYEKLTPPLYSAVIDEAHKNGLRVTAHIFTLEDAKGALRAGVDAFAHSVRDRDVDDEFMMLVKQHPNLVVNPNLPDRGVKVDVSWLKPSLSETEMKKVEDGNIDNPKAQAFYGIQARNLKKLNEAGVTIVMGTDGNTPWGPHVEMADMVAAGMTPAQVIMTATRNAAEFLRIRDAGTLEQGKSADFIVLDANPMDDITNTRRIASVYLRGVAVDRSKAP